MKIFPTVMFLLIAARVAATTDLVISPATTTAKCPNVTETYYVSAASGNLPSCTYTWIVTNGTIEGSNLGTSVGVKWTDNNQPGTRAAGDRMSIRTEGNKRKYVCLFIR